MNDFSPASASAPVFTAASSGKEFRLGRLFAADGRAVILPVDHGTMLGRVAGLEDPVALVARFLPLSCDGFLLGPRVAERTSALFAHRAAPARLLTIDSYWRGAPPARHVLITSVARAAALGVDGVKVLMPWDTPAEERAVCAELVAAVIGEAEPFGLPVMVEPICLAAPRPADAVAIEGDGARMAAELGADILKVVYPGDPELLSAWCAEFGVPLVILGGPAGGETEELYRLVADAMAAGARGITIGRRVWQRPVEEAAEVLGRLASIVHPGTVVSPAG
jgi:fructose-bisphosphate aldolase, class I